MPLTQDDPKFDKGLESYTDPGSIIDGNVFYSIFKMNVLMSTYVSVNNQFDPNTLKSR